MHSISPPRDRRFKRHAAVLRQDVSGAVVLFNMESGLYYSLNDIGTRIWDLCDSTRSVADIVAVVAAEYGEAEAVVHDDVVDLFAELADEHLLLEVAPAS